MDHVFIDTNIFLKENFLQGTKINEFFKLAQQEHLKLVLTCITIEEVKSNFKKRLKRAIHNHGEFMNMEFSNVLKNNEDTKKIFLKLNKNQIVKSFNEELDLLINKSNVTIIEYAELNIKAVFEKYFTNKPPFHHADKKSEFPDAFATELLEQWCEAENAHCVVLTLDKGIIAGDDSRLTVVNNYEDYLDSNLKILLRDRKNILEILFEKNSDSIDNKIKTWYSEKLEDEFAYFDIVSEEIHEIEIGEINILSKSLHVVSIEDEEIEIEIVADVEYNVALTIDDINSSIYDPEDKRTLYFDTTKRHISGSDDAVIKAFAYISSVNSYNVEIIIDSINLGYNFQINDETLEW